MTSASSRMRPLRAAEQIDAFRAQHDELHDRIVDVDGVPQSATFNASESPLVWLARRKSKDGRALIDGAQLQAGERLRFDFTRAGLGPRVTASWDVTTQRRRGGAGGLTFSDVVIAARQCVRQALDAVGPEFSGVLLDVCCFLKGLEDVERERNWPARSGKVVLQLGLDRLARHYGYGKQARGRARQNVRTWLAEDAGFTCE